MLPKFGFYVMDYSIPSGFDSARIAQFESLIHRFIGGDFIEDVFVVDFFDHVEIIDDGIADLFNCREFIGMLSHLGRVGESAREVAKKALDLSDVLLSGEYADYEVLSEDEIYQLYKKESEEQENV